MPQDYAVVAGKRYALSKAPNAILRLLMAQLGFLSDLDVRAGFISGPENERIGHTAKNIEHKTGTGREITSPKASTSEEYEPRTNAELGFLHEYGAPAKRIPARPFLIRTIDQQKDFIKSQLSTAITQAIKRDDKAVIKKTLNIIGMKLRDQAKNNIRTQDGFKPLSKRTIQMRRERGLNRTKALIDTGEMLNAITYEVTPR